MSVLLTPLFLIYIFLENAQAAQTYTPGNVFAGVEYSNRILNRILESKGIRNLKVPQSKEKAAKPMHVYELHVSVLHELYDYANKNNRRPPPLAVSSPIKYTPTDVYYLTQLMMNNIEEIYRDSGGVIDFSMKNYTDKTPVHVYQELFKLYYNLNRLNNKNKVSPSEVYAHIYRAKKDLQTSLLIISKRLDDSSEKKKRLLVTAIYGMHTDGTVMSPLEKNKNPGDVIEKAFEVRDRLNELRKRNNLSIIKHPTKDEYSKVKPIDVFLQTQFIIAELNLLKIPMELHTTTANVSKASSKTPSDVHHEMKHIVYMLDRLMKVL